MTAIEETIYLVEVDAYDESLPGVRTLRYSSGGGYVTSPSATPANTFYAPRVKKPVEFSRSAFSDARVMGGSSIGLGEVILANADGGLNALLDYGFDGRALRILVGRESAAYPAGFTEFFAGTIEAADATTDTIVLRVRDRLAILDLPLSELRYAGTNSLPSGKEGTEDDIKGQIKPRAYGRCYHVPLICVNTAKQIWQCHDGTVHAIDAVYDRGIVLTFGSNHANLAALEAATVASNTYHTCKAEGLVRFGTRPFGPATADIRGDATGSYVDRVGAIVKRILITQCGVDSGDIDSSSFTALDAAADYEVGIYIAGEQSRQSVIDQLLLSVGAWLVPDRTGLWQVGRLTAPTGSPAATFTADHILSQTKRPPADPERGVPVWQVSLRYKRYWQSFGDADVDIAGGVSDATKAQMVQEFRTVTSDDSSVKTAHLLSPVLKRDTLLVSATDAQAEADRLLALHKVRRDLVDSEVAINAGTASLDLGQEARLKTSRMGYSAGRDFRVIGISTDGRKQKLTAQLWG